MSHAVHIVNRTPPGYFPSDGKTLPCSGISSRKAYVSSCTSIGYRRSAPSTGFESLRCHSKRALVCRASSNGFRKNPDFSRQNRFSRSRNRQNEEKDNFDNLEESEPISTKNGSTLSISETPKHQATAAPGPREKEIVELFRKVQAQLRERAVIKEEKKIEALQGKGKDNETVDSLLKLLRKHSVEQSKRTHNSNGTGDFADHHPETNAINGDSHRSPNFFNSANPMREEPKPSNSSPSRRPVSNFRKRSPVPKVKYQPVYIRPESDAVATAPKIKRESKIETRSDDLDLELEEELDLEPEPPKSRPEPGLENILSNMTIIHEQVSSDEEISASEIEEHDEEEEPEAEKETELVSMKLTELRALAKTRGLKCFSRLKKSELVELLSQD